MGKTLHRIFRKIIKKTYLCLDICHGHLIIDLITYNDYIFLGFNIINNKNKPWTNIS